MSLQPPISVINLPADQPSSQFELEKMRLAQALPARDIIWCAISRYSAPDFIPKFDWVAMRMAHNRRRLVPLYADE